MSGQQNVDHIWTEKVGFLRPLKWLQGRFLRMTFTDMSFNEFT